jgi:hypothetical protein
MQNQRSSYSFMYCGLMYTANKLLSHMTFVEASCSKPLTSFDLSPQRQQSPFSASLAFRLLRSTSWASRKALDPNNPTGFLTGLTFVTDGSFTGTMTPISIDVAAVPEPEAYAKMLAGLSLVGFAARRRKQKAA